MSEVVGALRSACEKLLADQPEFWLAIAASDVSYEVGKKAGSRTPFGEITDAMKAAGCPNDVISQMRLGPGGNLSAILRTAEPTFTDIRYDVGFSDVDRSLRPDIQIGSKASKLWAIIEIKAIHAATLFKFFAAEGTHSVSDDMLKFGGYRERGFTGEYLSLIFFINSPHYEYPAGRGLVQKAWKAIGQRPARLRRTTVEQQYERVKKNMPPTMHDSVGLYNRVLPAPSDSLLRCLQRWSRDVYVPGLPWELNRHHLEEVAVGFSIWELKG